VVNLGPHRRLRVSSCSCVVVVSVCHRVHVSLCSCVSCVPSSRVSSSPPHMSLLCRHCAPSRVVIVLLAVLSLSHVVSKAGWEGQGTHHGPNDDERWSSFVICLPCR
jgi:hypothetical protein